MPPVSNARPSRTKTTSIAPRARLKDDPVVGARNRRASSAAPIVGVDGLPFGQRRGWPRLRGTGDQPEHRRTEEHPGHRQAAVRAPELRGLDVAARTHDQDSQGHHDSGDEPAQRISRANWRGTSVNANNRTAKIAACGACGASVDPVRALVAGLRPHTVRAKPGNEQNAHAEDQQRDAADVRPNERTSRQRHGEAGEQPHTQVVERQDASVPEPPGNHTKPAAMTRPVAGAPSRARPDAGSRAARRPRRGREGPAAGSRSGHRPD